MNTCRYAIKKKINTIQYGYRKCKLTQECLPKHSRMGTARMRDQRDIRREQEKRREYGK